jgi:diaminopimelate decarboxylase
VTATRHTPFSRTCEFRGGRLHAVGRMTIDDLAAEFGTPLYVMDRAELVARMRAYREAFGPDVAITYAAKALCVVGILQLAAREGLHLDVASGGELHTAAVAGFPMERVVFHGNNKSPEELDYAVGLGVGRFMLDSFTELRRLDDLGRRAGRPLPALLRVTPGVQALTHEFIATGHDDSKFGFTLSSGLAHRAVDEAIARDGIDLRGLHCHVGSQIFDTESFERAAAVLTGLLAELGGHHGVTLAELNLGGGLGIAYTAEDRPLPIPEYAAALLAAVDRAVETAQVPRPRLAVEPGRSIVGPAGLTLYRVGTVKDIPGVRTYVSVDGGMSDNLRPALYGARYTFAPAGAGAPAEGEHVVTIAGKHCESGDVLAHDVALPGAVAEGELLAVAATGAYGHAMANNYNRLGRPAMVLVGDGEAHLLVRRETLDDVVARDVLLPSER